MDELMFAADLPDAAAIAPSPQQQEDDDLRHVLASPHGLRFIRRLLGQGRIFQTSFSPDPLSTAFGEGQRNQALALIAMVSRAAPDRVPDVLPLS